MRTQRGLRTSLTSGTVTAVRGLALLCLVPLLGACGASKSKDPGPAAGATVMTDANNYWSQTDLTIPVVDTASDGTDFQICWSDVSDDLQCHSVDAEKDIITVTFVPFPGMTQQEVTDALDAGTDPPSGTVMVYDPDGSSTCMNFTDFHSTGSSDPIDADVLFEQYKEGDTTYLLTFSSSKTLGTHAKTMMFIEPNADSDNVMVNAVPGCADSPLLDYQVDIASKDTLQIPMDGPPWLVDWSQVTKDSVGNDAPWNSVNRLLLGFYAGYSVKDIEDDIYNIEQDGELWELEMNAKDLPKSADLADVKPVASDGSEFEGFDQGEDGTWLLALMCDTCASPAPVFLTVIEPTSGAD